MVGTKPVDPRHCGRGVPLARAFTVRSLVGYLWIGLALLGCTTPRDLCLQTAERLYERDVRCGEPATSPDDYEVVLGGPDCENATTVREPTELVEDCWPALEISSCSPTVDLPEACHAQF